MDEKTKGKLKKSFIIAGCIFVFDALVADQGLLSLVTLFVVVFIFIPWTAYLLLRKRPVVPHLLKCLIYALMAFSVFGVKYLNRIMAQSRAETIIAAVEQYKADNNMYPQNLEVLVPEYLEKVPKAKFSVLYNQFRYHASEGNPFMYYYEFPPYGRQGYKFKQKLWYQLKD